uniref:P15 protein n=1 Tax=Passion fruit green spot virus TaxID=989895 RepID=A0A5P9KIL0_9VIRU|nr:P15 protein [Passion fruit green spot virus]
MSGYQQVHFSTFLSRDDLGYPEIFVPETITCGCARTSIEEDTFSFLVENFCRVFSCDEIYCLNLLRILCSGITGDPLTVYRIYLSDILHDISCDCYSCEGQCQAGGFFTGRFRNRRTRRTREPGSPTSVLD